MTDFNKLIPELQEAKKGAGISVESWLSYKGNFQLAIGYSAILWPQFVEFERYVLQEGFSIKTLRDWERP